MFPSFPCLLCINPSAVVHDWFENNSIRNCILQQHKGQIKTLVTSFMADEMLTDDGLDDDIEDGPGYIDPDAADDADVNVEVRQLDIIIV